MSDECSLSYRLSTELTTTSNNEAEEIVSFGKFIRNKTKQNPVSTYINLYITIDHPLNTNDKIKSFQFNDVITPLG
jgi:hypothetical protein